MATTAKYADDVDALRSDLKAVQADLATLTKRLTGDMRNGAHNVAADATAAGLAGVAKAQQAGQQGADAISDTVRENPFASIATAAGVGFVIGTLLRRS